MLVERFAQCFRLTGDTPCFHLGVAPSRLRQVTALTFGSRVGRKHFRALPQLNRLRFRRRSPPDSNDQLALNLPQAILDWTSAAYRRASLRSFSGFLANTKASAVSALNFWRERSSESRSAASRSFIRWTTCANSQTVSRPEPFAHSVLARGLVERHTSGVDSSWVFPSEGDARPMHAVTALRATEAIMRACGVADRRQARASPQTLRNSYIATLFEAGQTTLAVSEVLGVELITAERLKKAWQKWAQEKSVIRI
ncbi:MULTISPECIES: hypothetical protein [Burkholderiaceae]|uniref:hypothetical protein n=1 Tax=Burkholderiaceae TaxID=119060 RepID=UPI00095BFDD9|nr:MULTISPECIES: hypothetical protein [Burkholderiaceae]SIT64993.1 hypothetical protein SAMN04487769_0227 [Burkholderia sp. b14]